MPNGVPEVGFPYFVWKLALGAVGIIVTAAGAVSVWALVTLIDVSKQVDVTASTVSAIGSEVSKLGQSHWELVHRVDEEDKRMDGIENKADAAFAGQCAACAQNEAERAKNHR